MEVIKVNGFFISSVGLDSSQGGLYHATIERLSRLRPMLKQYNGIFFSLYDYKFIKMVRRILGRTTHKKIRYTTNMKNSNLIENLHIKKTLFYYIYRVISYKMLFQYLAKKVSKYYGSELLEADFIQVHGGTRLAYIGYLISKMYRVPLFLTFHGSDINYASSKTKELLVNAMESSEKCVFVSKKLKENAIKKLGYSGNNAIISYNGVQEIFLNQELINYKANNTIGFIGSLESKKGADFLPEIFDKISRNTKGVNFKIIGDGSLKQELQKQIFSYDLTADFSGNIHSHEVIEELKSFRYLIVPSRNEGLGIVILEALTLGVPVIGTNIGGIPEAIGQNEFLINFDEKLLPKRFADKVTEIEKLNIEFDCIYNRQRIEKYFNWNKIANQEFKVYLNALGTCN